ncbi:hypothetical protein COU76_04415 [Candidatus Peregrinibacteria bacterium CG10_big_fil_rev_8_21_14_0_10_49_10]|nr:MAG: hypothetical protein COU76_04415 [Candidatus Peregrinibacteria bacterium CG10_big_fil_rev_8_21_14_0_10_49_10]
MKHILTVAFFVLALALPFSGVSAAEVHPYDMPERMTHEGSHRSNKLVWAYDDIQRYYAATYRTTTHMLHPYYRSAEGRRYGRIPQSMFEYTYREFAAEVIRPDRKYGE